MQDLLLCIKSKLVSVNQIPYFFIAHAEPGRGRGRRGGGCQSFFSSCTGHYLLSCTNAASEGAAQPKDFYFSYRLDQAVLPWVIEGLCCLQVRDFAKEQCLQTFPHLLILCKDGGRRVIVNAVTLGLTFCTTRSLFILIKTISRQYWKSEPLAFKKHSRGLSVCVF